MYNDLGVQFCSPTVNMLFAPKDFISFMKNVYWYLEQEIVFAPDCATYPVGKLGDIEIRFLHYHSEQEVLSAWDKRLKRINWGNIYLICCDEGLCYEDMVEFDNLPYEHKILFVHEETHEIKSAVLADCFKEKMDARLLNFANPFGRRYYQRYVDYVRWLNND